MTHAFLLQRQEVPGAASNITPPEDTDNGE